MLFESSKFENSSCQKSTIFKWSLISVGSNQRIEWQGLKLQLAGHHFAIFSSKFTNYSSRKRLGSKNSAIKLGYLSIEFKGFHSATVKLQSTTSNWDQKCRKWQKFLNSVEWGKQKSSAIRSNQSPVWLVQYWIHQC